MSLVNLHRMLPNCTLKSTPFGVDLKTYFLQYIKYKYPRCQHKNLGCLCEIRIKVFQIYKFLKEYYF